MNWQGADNSIVLVGALAAVACALPGCFLVLRRMSMMGDALSHAVLPGLAVAFLLSGDRISVVMFLGAVGAGLLTAFFTHAIGQWGNVDRGASMGIVFTSLFALGLLLIVQAADYVDLDPGCVLYGSIELTPLDLAGTLSMGGWELAIPRVAVTLAIVVLINLAFIVGCFKELRLSSFDPALATVLGFRATLMHYLLMALVAVTTVAAFEAVGSILVIAMLIAPPAAAYLLTRRLVSMLVVSVLLAVASAFLGHVGALAIPRWFGFGATNTAGMMAVATGFLVLLAVVFSPRSGLLVRWRKVEQPPKDLPKDRGVDLSHPVRHPGVGADVS